MKKLLFALPALLFLSLGSIVHAQSVPLTVQTVGSCGSPPHTYTAGKNNPATQDTTGTLCTTASSGGNQNVTITSPAVALDATLTGAQSTHSGTTGNNAYIIDPSTGNPITYSQPTNVQGPTAVGSAAANPPVLTGGTADGTGTGTVGVLKIVSGVASHNVAQVNGVTTLTGSGATGTGSQRVTVATDSATVAGSASIPAGTNLIGKTGIDQTTPGTTNNVTVSTNVGTLPLIQATASVPITFTAAGGPTQIIAASGSTKIYITHWDVVLSGAGTFALVTGTGTNCGTNTAYLTGASGHPLSFAANGGISAGSGLGPILVTIAGGEVCAITTGAVDSSGSISYAQF